MSETTTTRGGFAGDPADTAAGPCCGTTADAQAAGSCCGSSAKAEAVASGAGCCG
jgi:hypothetical protein